jgi:FAD/FMN-containing dehydrogenase
MYSTTSAGLDAGTLREQLTGAITVPGDAGWDEARRAWNLAVDQRPAAVAEPETVADVVAVVNFARERGLRVAAQGTGHAASALAEASLHDTILVKTHRMRVVEIDPDRRRAQAQAGALWADVVGPASEHGLAALAGSSHDVGVVGYCLGGGLSWLARKHGLAANSVTAVQIVTADGRVVVADAHHDADLFWAVRGGGGSFGIVTAMRLRARRVTSAAWFFASFPRSSAGEALAAWDDLAPGAPRALTSIFTVPGGSGNVTALGQYLGSESALRRLVAPLRRVRGARLTAGTSGYLALQRRWAGCADGGLALCHSDERSLFAGSSVYVAERLSAAARADFLSAARTGATLILDAYGGAINEVAPDATAFVHRHARFSVQILSYAGDVATARARVARARARVAPHGNGQAYQNYADPSLSGAAHAYYGANYARLQRVKTATDPDNRFRPNQGVRAS